MTTWSTEEVVDAVISTLQSQLPAALDAIYAARLPADQAAGRSIDPVPPQAYFAGAVSTILVYPTVEVALPDLNMSNFDLALVEADVTENLVVLLWDRSAQMDVLYRKVTRLAAAAYDVLLQPNAIDGATVKTVRASWRFNPEAQERDEIVSGALLVLGLESTRTRP